MREKKYFPKLAKYRNPFRSAAWCMSWYASTAETKFVCHSATPTHPSLPLSSFPDPDRNLLR